MASKGGFLDSFKATVHTIEVGMRFMNNVDKYRKNAQVLGNVTNKLFGKKEKEVDAGMCAPVTKSVKADKIVAPANPLLDRMMEDKTFSEFLAQIFDEKTFFGGVKDNWEIQQSLIDKYPELEAYKTMGQLRKAAKKLLGK